MSTHLTNGTWEGGVHEPPLWAGTVEVLGVVEDDLYSFELLLYPQFHNNPKNASVPEEV